MYIHIICIYILDFLSFYSSVLLYHENKNKFKKINFYTIFI